MAERRLRAGIIGLGVGEQHIRGYEADPRCQVAILCDRDLDKLSEVNARYPGKVAVSHAMAVVQDASLDVVSVASYDDDHRAHVVAALQAGKHVFVEKPLCLTSSELQDIVDHLNRRPDLRLSSNLILRRSPRFIWLKQQITAGRLGVPYYVEADYNYGRLHKITEGWRGRIPHYSVMHGGGIHVLDLITWLLGQWPLEVTAFGNRIVSAGTTFNNFDFIVSLLRFESGLIAKVSANFGCVFPHHHNLMVYGTQASFMHNERGVWWYASRDPVESPVKVDAPYPAMAKGDMLPSFVRSILDGSYPDVTEEEVVRVMAISLAAQQAAETSAPVKINYPVLGPRTFSRERVT